MGKSLKGSRFEREFCRLLSLWWTQKDKEPADDVFWRTAGSGARATVRSKAGKRTANHEGDINATTPDALLFTTVFTTELKRGYPGKVLTDLLDRSDSAGMQCFEEWVEQARAAHLAAHSASWLLVTRRNHREAIVTMPYGFANRVFALQAQGYSRLAPIAIMDVDINGRAERIVTMTLKKWLEKASPAHIRRMAKEYAHA